MTGAWLKIKGHQVPLIQYLPDWGRTNPSLEFISKVSINRSGQDVEQRGTVLQEGELSHTMRVSYCEDLTSSTRIYNKIRGAKGKGVVVPIWPEPLEDTETEAQIGRKYFKPDRDIRDIKILTSEILKIDITSPDKFEARTVIAADPMTGVVHTTRPWHTEMVRPLYLFCRGMTLQAISRPFATDGVHVIEALWASYDDGALPSTISPSRFSAGTGSSSFLGVI